jgi:hypothetical protein
LDLYLPARFLEGFPLGGSLQRFPNFDVPSWLVVDHFVLRTLPDHEKALLNRYDGGYGNVG